MSIPERAPSRVEDAFPEAAWQTLVHKGVPRWTIPRAYGGEERSSAEVLDGCIELARVELAPVFILTQFQSAITRLVASDREEPRAAWLKRLATGECFTTVGISHLTTSRQHVARPTVLVERVARGYRLTGEVPWVTAGRHADVIVTGGALDDGQQLLCALPRDRAGISVEPHERLLALTESQTGPVTLKDVEIRDDEVLAGPVEKVIQIGGTGGTGSLMTSALAIGHAIGCVDRLAVEARSRPILAEIVKAFEADAAALRNALMASAAGRAGEDDTPETLRARATSLALSASQAYLTACKGAGFVQGHPAERLAREAMFFLVWSCPQAVSSKLLREFSGCED